MDQIRDVESSSTSPTSSFFEVSASSSESIFDDPFDDNETESGHYYSDEEAGRVLVIPTAPSSSIASDEVLPSPVTSSEDDYIVVRGLATRSSASVSSEEEHDLSEGIQRLVIRNTVEEEVSAQRDVDDTVVTVSTHEEPLWLQNQRRCLLLSLRSRQQKKSSKMARVEIAPVGEPLPSLSYQAASQIITAYLENPDRDSQDKLPILQAFLAELGVCSAENDDEFPHTITSAKKMIRAEVHISIKEYVKVRGQGQEALKNIMRPSKSALAKEIRNQKGKRASLHWVKSHGLKVFLVQCF